MAHSASVHVSVITSVGKPLTVAVAQRKYLLGEWAVLLSEKCGGRCGGRQVKLERLEKALPRSIVACV